MTDPADGSVSAVGDVTVRYWAAARSAAGIEAATVPVGEGATLADWPAAVPASRSAPATPTN